MSGQFSDQIFEDFITRSPEPYRTIVKVAIDNFYLDYFKNKVVWNQYDGKQKVLLNAIYIVGIVPGVDRFLDCQAIQSSEREKPQWVSRFVEVSRSLSVHPLLKLLPDDLVGSTVIRRLNQKIVHVVGMVSLHTEFDQKESFGVLWCHPELLIDKVGYFMKIMLKKAHQKQIFPISRN